MSAITVVIPTYNRARYLPQAIDSVLQQTVSDVEIIVVDDGSTDDTRDRVQAYGDRVRYIYTANGGSAHARNVGMHAARGRYLTFLDSDDLYYPYTLELQSRVLDRHPEIAMLYTEMSGFDDRGFFERYHLKKYHDSAYRNAGVTYERMFSRSTRLGDMDVVPGTLRREEPEVLERRVYFGNIFDWYLTNLVLFTNSMMLRREVVPAIGDRNVCVKYWEEMEYTLRITRNHTVGFVDVPTYKLRYHDDQISATSRAHDGRYVWLRKQQILLRVVKKHAMADPVYYRRHRNRIDAHLAHLHRAVAVPLLVSDPRGIGGARRYVRAARQYLTRSCELGHPERLLWLITFAPRSVRRLALGLLEEYRKLRRRHGTLVRATQLPA